MLSDLEPRGSRVVRLRHLEGLTQAQLADRIDLTQGFVSHVENGTKPVPSEMVAAMCEAFGLPPSFFAVSPGPTDRGAATFRKSSTARVRDENAVVARFDEAARLFHMASHASGYRTAQFTTVLDEDPENTAANLRSELGLAIDAPVLNATRSVERLGVGVVHELGHLDAETSKHDGISRPSDDVDRPLIATVRPLPPAVKRLTVMHELGHLVYDRSRTQPIPGTRAPEERRAFQFAGAMLIPAGVVRERITETLNLHGYLRVKADYGISVPALIKRAVDLGVITQRRQRSLMIQYSSQGWRDCEPVDVADEAPRLLTQAITRGISDDPDTVATATGVAAKYIRRWAGLRDVERPTADVIPLRRP